MILESYIEHLKLILYKSYEYDLSEAKLRIEILDGYLKALASIDQIITIIKTSSSKEEAKEKLIEIFKFSERQVKAVLDLKLQRLVNLEAIKIQKEHSMIQEEIERLNLILSDDIEFAKHVKKEVKYISDAYGDEHRTTNLSLNVDDNVEIVEEKNLVVYFTNYGNLYADETTTLITQRKGGRGNKIKLQKGETIIQTINGKNNFSLLIFTNIGRAYNLQFDALTIDSNIHTLLDLAPEEQVVQVTSNNKAKHIIFITKNGLIKKSLTSLYNITRKGVMAIKLLDKDTIIKVLFINEEDIALLTNQGLFKIIETKLITATGRVSQGVIAAKLNLKDYLVDAQLVEKDSLEIISVTDNGMCTKINLNDFTTTGRSAKGKELQKGNLVGFVLIGITNKEIAIISSQNIIKIPISSISLTNRGSVGTRVINLKENNVIGVIKGL